MGKIAGSILIAIVVGSGGWYGYKQYRAHSLVETINSVFGIPKQGSGRLLALDLTRAALAKLSKPNFYAVVSSNDTSGIAKELADLKSSSISSPAFTLLNVGLDVAGLAFLAVVRFPLGHF